MTTPPTSPTPAPNHPEDDEIVYYDGHPSFMGYLGLFLFCLILAIAIIAIPVYLNRNTPTLPTWTYAVAPVIALFTAVRDGRRQYALIVTAAGYLTYLLVRRANRGRERPATG